MNDPLDKNSKETKEKQTKLREIQLKRDNGNTYGHDYKDPCKKEKQMSFDCIEMSRTDDSVDCASYFENYKLCKQFWNAVQRYRSMNMKKSKYDLPKDEEHEKWKKKLPEWLATKNLTPPDDL